MHEAGQAHSQPGIGLYPSHVKLGTLQKATVALLSAVGASLKCDAAPSCLEPSSMPRGMQQPLSQGMMLGVWHA